MKSEQPTRLLRIKEVSEISGLKLSTIWKYVKLQEFPQPFKLSMRVTVWDSNEVDEWVQKQLQRA